MWRGVIKQKWPLFLGVSPDVLVPWRAVSFYRAMHTSAKRGIYLCNGWSDPLHVWL